MLEDPLQNRDEAGFTGHVRDHATGLTYAQARFYDPVTARFHSPDPVGFSAGGPGYFNRYAYTMNDPVNMTDPTGMCAGPAVIPCAIGARILIGKIIRHAAGTAVTGSAIYLNSDSPDSADFPDRKAAEGRITGGTAPDRETGQRQIWDNPPTGETADEIFGEIAKGEGVEVIETEGERGAVDVAVLPDGSRVIDRNSSGGTRTIETQDRRGRTRTETRFPDDPPKEIPEG